MKTPRTLYLRTVYGRGLVAVGLLALAAQGACGREICAGVDGGCLALRVEGNDDKEPIFVDVLDAFGQRLVRRQTDPSPHSLIEVAVPRPEAAQCLRVFVGSGAARKTAVVRLDGLSEGVRIDRSLKLSPPPGRAIFMRTDKDLVGRGSGVAIGRVPGFTSPLLVVGSVPGSGKSVLQFFKLADGATSTATSNLEVDAPPAPIALAGGMGTAARLAVGPSPLEGVDGPVQVFLPAVSGIGFASSGQVLALGSNQRATSLAAADLDNDQAVDLVVNWNNTMVNKSGTSIFRSASGLATAALDDGAKPTLSAITTADLDSDGFLDLVRSLDSEVRIYLNQRSKPGTFATASTLLDRSQMRAPLGLATGDLNGDERLDVAATINTKADGVTPENSFSLYLANKEPLGTFQRELRAMTAALPRAAAAADMNGDFLDDVVIASYGNGTTRVAPTLLYGNASGDFQQEDLAIAAEAALIDVATGDLNGDCIPDLALVAQQSNNVIILLNRSVSVQ